MVTLSPNVLALEQGSPEAATLQKFFGRGEWRAHQLAEALSSLRCLEVPEPDPASPGGPLLGLVRALQCSRAEEPDSGALASLDDSVLQARIRFRMAEPRGSEGQELGADIDYVLALVQDLASRLREERRAHAQELERLRQDVGCRAPRRSRQAAGEGAPAATPDTAAGAKAGRGGGGQDQIQAIRRAQGERRAALADAVARMQREMEETRARERSLAEEKQTLIKGEVPLEAEFELASPGKSGRRTSTTSPGSLASSGEPLGDTSPEDGSRQAAGALRRGPFLLRRASTCGPTREQRARRGRRLLRGSGCARGPFIVQVREAMGELCEEEGGEAEEEPQGMEG